MKKTLLLIAVFAAFLSFNLSAQNVGIGISTPHASAKLHIEDANRGVMINRVSLVDVTNGINPVASPLTGLLVYNINATVAGGQGEGFYYWDGSRWVPLGEGNHNTLDMAYDEGGPGSGRIINADAGRVEINGTGGLLVDATTTTLSEAALANNTNGTESAVTQLSWVGTSAGNTYSYGVRGLSRMTTATNLYDGGIGVYGVTSHPFDGIVNLNATTGSVNKAVGLFGAVGSRTSFTGSPQDMVAAVVGATGLHNSSGGSVSGSRLYSGLFQGNGRVLGLWGENSSFIEMLPRWQTQDYDAAVIGFYNSAANGGNNGGSIGTADSYFSIETNVTDATSKNLVLQTRSVGNVGIGTATPSEKLHLVGNARISSLSGAGNRLVQSNATGVLSNVAAGAPGQVLTTNGAGVLSWGNTSASAWDLLGNAGTNPSANFVGTTDNQALVFRTNSIEAARIHNNQNMVVGSTLNTARFQVEVLPADGTTDEAIYNRHDGTSTGITYAMRNDNNSATNSTKYGFYNYVNSEGTGSHHGIYNFTYMNSAAGTSTSNGIYNYLNSYGTGNHRASYNYLNHSGADVSTQNYASYNLINISSSTNTSTLFGEYTEVDYSTGIRYGEFKELNTNATYFGTVYGDYNLAAGTGNDVIYGLYSDITNTGTGTHYGIFSNVPGGTNDFSAVFNAGNFVANEVGGDYDFRVESDTRTSALHVDASSNLVRFGSAFGSLSGNGTVVGGTTVDYVADFDNNSFEGTAIGIGSIEYLLDGTAETTINNAFSPTTHILDDLGYSTTDRAWDDVYADNFVNVSDLREKSNIENLGYGLKEVLAMRPVSYTLNRDPRNETKLGLIAQEVLPLVKEAVKTHDYKIKNEDSREYELIELERMGMTYQQLIPVLIKAIQEQQTQIDDLKKEIKELKK